MHNSRRNAQQTTGTHCEIKCNPPPFWYKVYGACAGIWFDFAALLTERGEAARNQTHVRDKVYSPAPNSI
eukprot:2302613-Rhodomonas_salina.1